MTITIIDGADATGANVAKLPGGIGIVALYVTGTGDIPATAAELAEYPGCLRIAQWPVLGVDEAAAADVLDFESQAATEADIAPWAADAAARWEAGARPGQRYPAVYASLSNMPAVAAALTAGHAPANVGLWVANWTGSRSQAVASVGTQIDGWRVIGVQYANMGAYDVSVFDASWVNARSVAPAAPEVPPGQWHDPRAWTWESAVIIGQGLNGKLCAFEYRPGAPWVRIT